MKKVTTKRNTQKALALGELFIDVIGLMNEMPETNCLLGHNKKTIMERCNRALNEKYHGWGKNPFHVVNGKLFMTIASFCQHILQAINGRHIASSVAHYLKITTINAKFVYTKSAVMERCEKLTPFIMCNRKQVYNSREIESGLFKKQSKKSYYMLTHTLVSKCEMPLRIAA